LPVKIVEVTSDIVGVGEGRVKVGVVLEDGADAGADDGGVTGQ